MKVASIQDIWRGLRRSQARPIRKIFMKWESIARISDGDIKLLQPITLVCGENGAGKSTILHALHRALAADFGADEMARYTRAHGGRIAQLTVDVNDGVARTLEGDGLQEFLAVDDDGPRVVLVDSAVHVPAVLGFIRDDANFADHLEGAPSRDFNAEELEHCSFILGRAYEKISVAEVSDTAFGEEFPYFSVRAHDIDYEQAGMGYGEAAVLYIIWAVSRLRDGALLLLEEPEAFLAPRAQIALIDVLADYALRRKLMIVMTSHSGPVASRLTLDEIVYLTRTPGTVDLHCPANRSDLITRLGLYPGSPVLVFVEDESAEILARVIIERYSAKLSGRVEYSRAAGEANVIRSIDILPDITRAMRFVGLLDGDQRDKYTGSDKRVVFLPSDLNPDALLRRIISTTDDEELGGILTVEATEVRRAKANAEGADEHDWALPMAETLSMAKSELLRRLALEWCKKNSADVIASVTAIESAADN